MPLVPGARLGNYEILSEIGSGGMGEVYEAKDLKLGRTVAIKVLPDDMSSDSERLRRFEQEARAASALNHPNIVTVHEIGEHEGTPYIAMEYVDGATLREMLAGGGLPDDALIRYVTQLAEGLAKAHQLGIVHRDLKPENIVVSVDGYVKILDFGLAKLLPEGPLSEEDSTMGRTTPGAILGTLSYLSPEQAKGQPVDHRSDQFAFGAIVYEMSTGRKAFERATAVETISAILRDEPVPATMPAGLESVARRCLSKARQDRYGSTTEILGHLNASRTEPTSRTKTLRSIAVLPLVNMSSDAEQEFFADGMTEALITDLAKLKGLKVISRSSAMRFKGTKKPLPEVASELGVEAILEGSVLRAGERVRISAQLVDAKADEHIWAERYERNLRDVLQLQNEVARAIAAEIHVTLTPQDEVRLRTAGEIDPAAFEAYLQGRYFWNKRTEDGLKRALEFFRRAVDIDPVYARAYAGLADVYNLLAILALRPADEAFPMAKAAAKRAIEIDDALGEAHTSLALASIVYDWNWDTAEREFRRAIEQSPDYATAHHFYGGYVLSPLGRHEQALEALLHAQELDPLAPVLRADAACVLLYGGQASEAIDQCLETLARFPEFPISYFYLVDALVREERYDEAIDAARDAVELTEKDPSFVARLGYALASAGLTKDAQTILADLEAAESSQAPAYPIALTYVRLGDTEKALEWLEKAVEGHAWEVLWMNVDVRVDPLRDERRFQDLLSRMNFPD